MGEKTFEGSGVRCMHDVVPSSGYRLFEEFQEQSPNSWPSSTSRPSDGGESKYLCGRQHKSAPAMLPAKVFNLVKPRSGKAVRPSDIVACDLDEQVKALEKVAQKNLDEGFNFGTIGQSFSARAAEQFRDSRRFGDIDLYNELDDFGKPTGYMSIVLKHDPDKPHRGPQDALLVLIRHAVRPHLASVLDELSDGGETSLSLMAANGLPMGQITPDLAVYSTPTEVGAAPTMIGQISYRHETLQELLEESKLTLDCSPVESAWAINVSTSRQANGAWKLPKMALMIMYKLGTEKVLAGPLSFGAETECNGPGETDDYAGLRKYRVQIRASHLLRSRHYPRVQNEMLSVDLYELRTLTHNLLKADGGLGNVQNDHGFRSRHIQAVQNFAEDNNMILQSRLTTRQQLSSMCIQMESD